MTKKERKKRFEIGVRKSSSWYWKPTWSGSNDNFFSVENGVGFKHINCRSYYIMTTIQLFFLGWIFYIKIKPVLISGEGLPMRYVKFEDTHLDLMDIPHGNWADTNTNPPKQP